MALSRRDALTHISHAMTAYRRAFVDAASEGDVYYNTEISTYLETTLLAVLNRIGSLHPFYAQQIEAVLQASPSMAYRLPALYAIASALYDAVDKDFLDDIGSLVRADVFTDQLDMAEHLLAEGYTLAAAVVVGISLETHLHQLARKNSIPLTFRTTRGDDAPKKADILNAELRANGTYNSLEQKNVTAWLDLRNKAAHGQADQFDARNVDDTLRGVRGFIAHHPA
jgi:hypothetical protein